MPSVNHVVWNRGKQSDARSWNQVRPFRSGTDHQQSKPRTIQTLERFKERGQALFGRQPAHVQKNELRWLDIHALEKFFSFGAGENRFASTPMPNRWYQASNV